MWPFEMTRRIEGETLTIRVQFLDCVEPIYNVFNDPDLVCDLGYQYILGAIEMNNGITLANHLGWDFTTGLTLPTLYWLTRNGEMPNLLPDTFTHAEEAFALGSILVQMAYAMRVEAAKQERIAG